MKTYYILFIALLFFIASGQRTDNAMIQVDATSVTKTGAETLTPELIYRLDMEANPAEWIEYYESIAHCANNNPGNLEYHGQPNSVKCGRWACFNTIEDGVRGLVMQLQKDINRGDTLESFLEDYAPSSENDLEGYISFVSNETGLGRHDKIADCDFIVLLKTIIKKEC